MRNDIDLKNNAPDPTKKPPKGPDLPPAPVIKTEMASSSKEPLVPLSARVRKFSVNAEINNISTHISNYVNEDIDKQDVVDKFLEYAIKAYKEGKIPF